MNPTPPQRAAWKLEQTRAIIAVIADVPRMYADIPEPHGGRWRAVHSKRRRVRRKGEKLRAKLRPLARALQHIVHGAGINAVTATRLGVIASQLPPWMKRVEPFLVVEADKAAPS